jgi:hypothetical protein
MTFEEASDMYTMNSIDPQLTCQCDEELQVLCQQCLEEVEYEPVIWSSDAFLDSRKSSL